MYGKRESVITFRRKKVAGPKRAGKIRLDIPRKNRAITPDKLKGLMGKNLFRYNLTIAQCAVLGKVERLFFSGLGEKLCIQEQYRTMSRAL